MIRRNSPAGPLLISQVDHAQLAADLAAAWGNATVPGLPLPDLLLPAIRDHDAGWRGWEAAPTCTPAGLPRAFTEMPMQDATAIWTRSIATCAGGTPSSAEALRRLRTSGGEVTPDDAAVLDGLLRHRGSVNVARLTADLAADTDLAPETIAETLGQFERAGVVRPLPNLVGGPALEITLPAAGASPLGGVWVSRHFCALAEGARETRLDDPAERALLDGFLEHQQRLQTDWAAAAHDFAGPELPRVLETGFRYVRYFDRLSLWLCMAQRYPAEADEPSTFPLSSGFALTFTPRTPREIDVSPWPFTPPALELSVPAVSLSHESAPLHWVLTPAWSGQ